MKLNELIRKPHQLTGFLLGWAAPNLHQSVGWMLTHTILFYFGSEMMVSEMSDLNDKCIVTTIANVKGMDLFALVLGIIFIFVATSKFFLVKKLLVGAGIGYTILTFFIIQAEFTIVQDHPDLATPPPAIVIWVLLSFWMLFVGFKNDTNSSP